MKYKSLCSNEHTLRANSLYGGSLPGRGDKADDCENLSVWMQFAYPNTARSMALIFFFNYWWIWRFIRQSDIVVITDRSYHKVSEVSNPGHVVVYHIAFRYKEGSFLVGGVVERWMVIQIGWMDGYMHRCMDGQTNKCPSIYLLYIEWNVHCILCFRQQNVLGQSNFSYSFPQNILSRFSVYLRWESEVNINNVKSDICFYG